MCGSLDAALRDRRVPIVEHEMIVAMSSRALLKRQGCAVLGPKNNAAGRMLTARLTNDLDGAVYAWCSGARHTRSSTDSCSDLSRDRWINLPAA
jgi:hypothetical protein